MRRHGALLIALLATLALCAQNIAFVGGFVWGAIHGAGAASLLAFLPAALGLSILWAGFFVLRRHGVERMTLVFGLYALGVFVLNEALLPGTPLKAWRGQRAMESVAVRHVRDDLLPSARGNPIGVRITFQAVVPRTGRYSISASTLASATGESPWPLHFGHSLQHRVDPKPPTDGAYDVLERGVVYTFSQDMLPNFLWYDERAKQPCLVDVVTKYISQADVLAALAKSRQVVLRTEIHVDGENGAQRVLAADYVTTRSYDLNAMYETIAAEGGKRCGR